MRLSRIAHAVNWKYAVGEVLLIVVGVTIALAVNSWNAGRERKAEEIRMLQQLSISLEQDRARIAQAVVRLESMAAGLKDLRRALVERAAYTEELDRDFGALTAFGNGTINGSVYESIKSRGLDVITNDELLSQIVAVFEAQSEFLENVNAIFRDEAMGFWHRPSAIHFEIGFDAQGPFAKPYDYERLLDDREFRSELDQRITLIDAYILGVYRDTASKLTALSEAIEKELASR